MAWKKFIFSGLGVLLFATGSGTGWAQRPSNHYAGSVKLEQRIDFGNAYIMGQSIKSGAVYLLHRKQSEIKSMLRYREDYREEILKDFKVKNITTDGPKAVDRNPKLSH